MKLDFPTPPFSRKLKSLQEDDTLHCEKTLRILPGKRAVYRGTWRQRPVIIKIFLDHLSKERHYNREKSGVKALSEAGVATPELLFSGHLQDKAPVLMFDFLPQANTALELWQSLHRKDDQLPFLLQLVELIAKIHQGGLVQEDLHLENFLVSSGKVYAIDGDAISTQREGRPLAIGASSKNLALFFAQLSPEHDALMEFAVLHYAEQRKLSGEQLLSMLNSDLPKIRRWRRHKYVKKSYRTCSEFIRTKRVGQLAISRRDVQGEALYKLLDDPDAFMRNGEVLKDGNTTTIVRVQIDNCDWVIKRYNIKSIWHILSRCFRPTRAWLSWGNAHRLKISGISTPRAVAMIEKRFGPLRSTGYYVCDFVAGPRAEVFFQEGLASSLSKEQAARGFVLLFELLRKLSIHHGDCKAANFIPNGSAPWVLDLDAMSECRSYRRFKRLYSSDRQRFLLNWQSQPELLRWFEEHLPR